MVKKNLGFFQGLTLWPQSLALTPKACGCNREEALMAQPAKLRTQHFLFGTEEITQLDRHEFLEFFFKKVAFANSVRLFFFPSNLSFSM